MARKMKTMDGNQAALTYRMRIQKSRQSTRSHRHPLCRSTLTNGRQKAERTSSERL